MNTSHCGMLNICFIGCMKLSLSDFAWNLKIVKSLVQYIQIVENLLVNPAQLKVLKVVKRGENGENIQEGLGRFLWKLTVKLGPGNC